MVAEYFVNEMKRQNHPKSEHCSRGDLLGGHPPKISRAVSDSMPPLLDTGLVQHISFWLTIIECVADLFIIAKWLILVFGMMPFGVAARRVPAIYYYHRGYCLDYYANPTFDIRRANTQSPKVSHHPHRWLLFDSWFLLLKTSRIFEIVLANSINSKRGKENGG